MAFINERLEEYVSSYGDHAQEALVSGKDLLALPIEDHRQYGDILRQAYEWQLQGMKKESILRRLLHEFR
jgi:tRNA nucleotidyltransferase (CCA-adding enzyme)